MKEILDTTLKFRLSKRLKEELYDYCALHDISVSALIRDLIEQYLYTHTNLEKSNGAKVREY